MGPGGLTTTEGATPPKIGTLNRLRQGGSIAQGPKDTIPITNKTPPRKQRSSRFHVTEKVELEKLPNFGGEITKTKGWDAVAQGADHSLFLMRQRSCLPTGPSFLCES